MHSKTDRFLRRLPTLTLLAAVALALAAPALAGTGGPDGFGYRFTDETPFSYLDIRAGGTPLYLDDDDSATVPIGFDFDFYGVTYSNIAVSSNGYALFDVGGGRDEDEYYNKPLPTDPWYDDIGPAVFPYWDDIDPDDPTEDPSDGYDVWVKTVGDAPYRRFIVQWYTPPLGGSNYDTDF
jgi:hypothetical protein